MNVVPFFAAGSRAVRESVLFWPKIVRVLVALFGLVSLTTIAHAAAAVSAPAFSPAAGSYATAQSVAMTSSTNGASIRYTIDGSTPSATAGTVYSSPVSISTTTTLKAIAYKTGSTSSKVTSGTYTITIPAAATPSFSPVAGTYTSAQTVTITSTTTGATIRYTTDGSTPSATVGTIYSSPVSVGTTTTLKAIAYKASYADSTVASGLYTINIPTAAPVFNPGAGTYTSAQNVTISSTTAGATIRYTTDGSTPTQTNGSLYAGPVNINSTVMLKAIAYGSGLSDSTVTNGRYLIGSSSVGTLNVLFDFNSSNNGGVSPEGALVLGKDGNFYGTARLGGSANNGTVFKVTPSGVLTTLASFTGVNGASPYGRLVQGSDGNFYGTTYGGGSSNLGTIFRVTPAGVLTSLVSFNGTNGSIPYAGLIQASDGNFYGTTFAGGSIRKTSDGTVFKMTPAGVLTSLISFNGTNGNGPYGGLVQASDGNFYGTTFAGGSSNRGTVFKITPAGILTSLFSFNDPYGGNPYASLLIASDGNLYGTTRTGGSVGDGSVFKITLAGASTTLASFDGSNAYPQSALVQDGTGNFYGTTSNGNGTIFKITPAGSLTTVLTFDGANGSSPYSGMVLGSDGNFYGTTQYGGAFGGGTFFQFIPPPPVAAPIFYPAPGLYTDVLAVTIASPTSGASIRYTTDGSTPSESNGTLYSGPVTISTTTTLKAIAFKTGLVNSSVTGGSYTLATAAPILSPISGTFTNPPAITITSATPGASIRYTTDDSTPTEVSGTLYSGPVTISTTTTLKAIAFKTGLVNSSVTGGSYTLATAAPILSPIPGAFTNPPAITITSATAGASIRYTTDGSTPTEVNGTLYSGPVTISATTSLKAIAYSSGFTDSSVVSGVYALQASAPVFSPADSNEHTVAITSATSGASIRYTLDVSTPTETHGVLYTGPIAISGPTTLQAIAYRNGFADSPISSTTIGIPTISISTPADGSTINAP